MWVLRKKNTMESIAHFCVYEQCANISCLLSVQGRKLRLSDGKGEKGDGKQVCRKTHRREGLCQACPCPDQFPWVSSCPPPPVLLALCRQRGSLPCHALDLSCSHLPPLPPLDLWSRVTLTHPPCSVPSALPSSPKAISLPPLKSGCSSHLARDTHRLRGSISIPTLPSHFCELPPTEQPLP